MLIDKPLSFNYARRLVCTIPSHGSHTTLFVVFVVVSGTGTAALALLDAHPERIARKGGYGTRARGTVAWVGELEEQGFAPGDGSAPPAGGGAGGTCMECVRGLFETLSLLRNRRMQLLVPPFVYGGLSLGFLAGDWTAYVVRNYRSRTADIGCVMIGFGASDAFFSLLFGAVSDRVGRYRLVVVSTVAQLAFLVTYMAWDWNEMHAWTHQGDAWVMLVGSAFVYGVGDATWNTIFSAIIGTLFPDRLEAAFSNFKLWQSAGFAIAFFVGAANKTACKNLSGVVAGTALAADPAAVSPQFQCEDGRLKHVFVAVTGANVACFLCLTCLHFCHTDIDTGRPAGSVGGGGEGVERGAETDYERMSY